MHKYLKAVTNINHITEIASLESKGLSYEKLSSIITSDSSPAPNLIYRNARLKAEFAGSILSKIRLHTLMDH